MKDHGKTQNSTTTGSKLRVEPTKPAIVWQMGQSDVTLQCNPQSNGRGGQETSHTYDKQKFNGKPCNKHEHSEAEEHTTFITGETLVMLY